MAISITQKGIRTWAKLLSNRCFFKGVLKLYNLAHFFYVAVYGPAVENISSPWRKYRLTTFQYLDGLWCYLYSYHHSRGHQPWCSEEALNTSDCVEDLIKNSKLFNVYISNFIYNINSLTKKKVIIITYITPEIIGQLQELESRWGRFFWIHFWGVGWRTKLKSYCLLQHLIINNHG